LLVKRLEPLSPPDGERGDPPLSPRQWRFRHLHRHFSRLTGVAAPFDRGRSLTYVWQRPIDEWHRALKDTPSPYAFTWEAVYQGERIRITREPVVGVTPIVRLMTEAVERLDKGGYSIKTPRSLHKTMMDLIADYIERQKPLVIR
jgi:hypothetical protein